jgi:hypothetical protein
MKPLTLVVWEVFLSQKKKFARSTLFVDVQKILLRFVLKKLVTSTALVVFSPILKKKMLFAGGNISAYYVAVEALHWHISIVMHYALFVYAPPFPFQSERELCT